jgi:hypothetical protein
LVIAPASLTVLELGGLMPYLLCLNDINHLSAISEEKEE